MFRVGSNRMDDGKIGGDLCMFWLLFFVFGWCLGGGGLVSWLHDVCRWLVFLAGVFGSGEAGKKGMDWERTGDGGLELLKFWFLV